MKDDDLERFLEGVVGVVEANSFETMCLWQRFHCELKNSWVQNASGTGRVIGKIDGRPVFLSLLTNTVRGYKILFIEPTSQVVDYEMIEQWLKAVLPADVPHRLVNAMNFHNVFPYEEHRLKSMIEGVE